MHKPRAATIVFTLVVLTVIVSTAIIVSSQYQRAERAEAHAADVEQQLATAQDTEAALARTQEDLDTTRAALTETDRSLGQTAAENATLTQREDDCRTLVDVSDRMLLTSMGYQKVVDHLLNHRSWHAQHVLGKVNHRIRGTLRTIEDAGYGTISELIDACTPTVAQ